MHRNTQRAVQKKGNLAVLPQAARKAELLALLAGLLILFERMSRPPLLAARALEPAEALLLYGVCPGHPVPLSIRKRWEMVVGFGGMVTHE